MLVISAGELDRHTNRANFYMRSCDGAHFVHVGSIGIQRLFGSTGGVPDALVERIS
jgi:hypothetical protein